MTQKSGVKTTIKALFKGRRKRMVCIIEDSNGNKLCGSKEYIPRAVDVDIKKNGFTSILGEIEEH